MYHTKLLDIKSTKQPKNTEKNSMIKVNTTIITTASSTAFITATTQPKEHRSPYIFFYGLACITINYYDMISPTRKTQKKTSCSQQDGLYSFFSKVSSLKLKPVKSGRVFLTRSIYHYRVHNHYDRYIT